MNSIWKKEPAWLEKKRQLAIMLMPRFPLVANQQKWLSAWQNELPGKSSRWLTTNSTITACPLATAVNQYSDLLQENLMEKAVRWQDNQLNAAHLAHLDCGQFIYVPSNSQGKQVVEYAPRLNSANPHNVIIIGANNQVIIKEKMNNVTSTPTYAATEILVGANSRVTYYQSNKYAANRTFQAIHAYQAHGSQLMTVISARSNNQLVTDLYSFLDGAKTFWQSQIGIAGDGEQSLQTMADGFGEESSAQRTVIIEESCRARVAALKTSAGEPLLLKDHVKRVDQLVETDF